MTDSHPCILMVPLMIDLSNRRVVIFGGGAVGTRKARYFANNAEVVVVSRSFSPEITRLPVTRIEGDITRLDDAALDRVISDAFLVVTATPDPEINERIKNRAIIAGALVNSTDGSIGSVILPAASRGSNYVIAVSSLGESPAIARYMREIIEAACPNVEGMVRLQSRIRSLIKAKVSSQRERSNILSEVIHDKSIWDAISHSEEEAWTLVVSRYLNE